MRGRAVPACAGDAAAARCPSARAGMGTAPARGSAPAHSLSGSARVTVTWCVNHPQTASSPPTRGDLSGRYPEMDSTEILR